MTSSHTGLTNKSTRAPLGTREQRRSSKTPYTTMDPDITLVCSELMTRLVYWSTTFRRQFNSNPLSAVLGKIWIYNNSILWPSVTIFQKVTSLRSKSPHHSRPTTPWMILTTPISISPAQSAQGWHDKSWTAQQSFMTIRSIIHFQPGLTDRKTLSTCYFVSKSTRTPFQLTVSESFPRYESFQRTNSSYA